MDQVLKCAACGDNNTHHCRVEVFNRKCEDAETGTHLTITDQTVVQDSSMRLNPSRRRDGVTITLWCENCDAITELSIVQHKGETVLTTYRCEYEEDYLDYLENGAERHFAEVMN
jgi:hypothetical protein